MSGARILVQKFGGTSVSTPERRARAVQHVRRARAEGFSVALVVSAMGRRGDPYATDTLLDLLRADGGPVAPADYDLMFTCGEAISVALLSQALKRAGIPSVGLTSAQARIYTDGLHVEASITEVDTSRLVTSMAAGEVPVVTGGQGVAPATLDYTTLGRGGSDTSAVALGAALRAARVDIFTDVDGVAVVDPRLLAGSRVLSRVGYDAMHELARFGAKVVHPRAIETARSSRVPVVVRSTFSDAPGTLIDAVEDERPLVGLAALPPMDTVVLPAGSVDRETRATWERRRLVMSLEEGSGTGLLVGAADDRSADLQSALAEIGAPPVAPFARCCWLSVVGDRAALERHHPAFRRLFADRRIAPLGWELTERRLTCVVPEAARAEAAALLYAAFEA
jgi:aspartate kinase